MAGDSVLAKFFFKEVLASDPDSKSIFVLLNNSSGENAVLLCNRNPFSADPEVWGAILNGTKAACLAQNDKYGNYRLFFPLEYSDVKATMVFPANEYDISKYRQQKRYIFFETAEDYANHVAPHLSKNKPSTEWVKKCLAHEAEADRIIMEDVDPQLGFVLYPDLKWEGVNIEDLYVQAIIRRTDITCLRDLNSEHLPMLRSVQKKTYEAIKERYGLSHHQVRAYFHYHPTFYHLHIHFINASYNAPGSQVGKAILLDDVIQNLQMKPDYYQKATLAVTVRENDPLFPVFAAIYPDFKV